MFFFKAREGTYRSTEEVSEERSIFKSKAQREPEPYTDAVIKRIEMHSYTVSPVE